MWAKTEQARQQYLIFLENYSDKSIFSFQQQKTFDCYNNVIDNQIVNNLEERKLRIENLFNKLYNLFILLVIGFSKLWQCVNLPIGGYFWLLGFSIIRLDEVYFY